MPEVALQTLDLVGRELNNTLGEARTALETFVEQPENVVLLQRCVSDLHQVQGVLRLLEIFGAALLAEEMEQVTKYLLTPASQKNQAETLDALMRAMVQLPSYVERVLAGGRDLALVLLPLLNDLRAVRGSPLLSEGTLLLLNLKSDQQAAPVAPAAGEPQLTVAQWARRLRTRFQLGLVGWIRGERPEQNLEILETVAHQLEQVATRQPVFQLWWVVGAIIEALREGGLETGVSIKRLLGLADREILQLYTQGEGRYAQNPPVELLNNLLYYAARATSNGPEGDRGARLLPAQRTAERRRLGRAGARESFGAVGEAHAHRRGGHPRGPRQGQRRSRHLRAPRRPAGRARVAGRHAAQDRRHARRARPRRVAPARHRRDRPPRSHGRRQDRRRSCGAGPHRRDTDQCRRPARSRSHRAHRPEGAARRGRGIRRIHRRGFPAGAVRRAARMQREPGARQGGDCLQRRRHARRRRARLLAGTHRRHQGRPDDARQDARRRDRRRHREESQGPAAAGWHRRSA